MERKVGTVNAAFTMDETQSNGSSKRIASGLHIEDEGIAGDVDKGSDKPTNTYKQDQTENSQDDDAPKEPEYVGDKFILSPPDEESLASCEKCFNSSKRIIKFFFAFILFCVMFGCVTVSKGSIIYITSQINKYVSFQKKSTSGEKCGVPVCADLGDIGGDVNCGQHEIVRWIWCMFICQCTPYLLMSLRCTWKMCFKDKNMPKMHVFLVVCAIESVQTVGMFMLLYWLLPLLDAYRSLFMFTAIATIPSFFLVFNRPPVTENSDTIDETLSKVEDTKTTKAGSKSVRTQLKSSERTVKLIFDICAFLCQISALLLWFVLTVVNPVEDPTTGEKISDICPVNRNVTKYYLEPSSYVKSNVDNDYKGETGYYKITLPPIGDLSTPPFLSNEQGPLPEHADTLWPLLLAPLLISVGYWENFVDKDTKLGGIGDRMNKFRKKLNKCKTSTYLFIGILKIILTFILILMYYGIDSDRVGITELFNTANFYVNRCKSDTADPGDFESDWLQLAAIQVLVGVLSFYTADIVIKGRLQVSCYTVPLMLSTPASFFLLIWACKGCDSHWDIGVNTYWNCLSGHENMGELFTERFIYIGILWWLSQLWISRYLWYPNLEKLAKIDKIFTYPMYCGATLEQSLTYIRRRNDFEFQLRQLMENSQKVHDVEEDDATNCTNLEPGYNPLFTHDEDGVPFIYICATMWHENAEEMFMMMKSLLRLDENQMARTHAQEWFKVRDPDYYEFEAHIFFDDAFTPYTAENEKTHGFSLNEYVLEFLDCINQAVKNYHNGLQQPPPTKYDNVPYGGRLEWLLPSGRNRLIVHLKDKLKIRNRKRWSQVMYIHYFLGQGILAQPVSAQRKDVVADNTYILALDGDIDFQPEAVILLLDLMKRNIKVAAACGRIHPTGNGPMVWYQKFEYSLSHWLQKATEHVLGCVLCSPGCFSLFRGSALMDENVAATYSKRALKPIEYVQYDQGEDRWLCTLLLQQGYRVEYAAAADAYTHAPVGFNEFYGQRRRWTTSTFANIMDLLKSARYTAKKNENISMLYMVYQGFLFASSILGPATIFMLVIGAFEAAFGIDMVTSFVVGLIPLVGFMILCFLAKNSTQLFIAAILSAVYAVLQMLVLIGIARQIVEDGVCSPSAVFFLFIAGTFVLAGLLHPQELGTLFHGFIYFLLIPCMYLLLIIYSLCNLHVVSWGTRENKPTKSQQELEAENNKKEAITKAKGAQDLEGIGSLKNVKGWKRLLASTVWGPDDDVNSSFTFNCGSLCRSMCCVAPGSSPQDKKLNRLQRQMTVLQGQLLAIHEAVTSGDYEVYTPNGKKRTLIVSNSACEDTTSPDNTEDNQSSGDEDLPTSSESESEEVDPHAADEIVEKQKLKPKRKQKIKKNTKKDRANKKEKTLVVVPQKLNDDDEVIIPPKLWIEEEKLGKGETTELNATEQEFWNSLIKKYLYPLDESNVDKEKIGQGLKTLRNRAVFAFFIIDMLLMVLILGLNLSIAQNEDLAIQWNCTVNGEVKTSTLDPVGFSFIIIFGMILAIQVMGMLIHRMFTFLQIISSTMICRGRNFQNGGKANVEQAIELSKDLQRIEPDEEEDRSVNSTQSGSSGYGTDFGGADGAPPQETSMTHVKDPEADLDDIGESGAPRKGNVVSKMESKKTVTKHTTMGRNFAKNFLALNEEVTKAKEIQDNKTHQNHKKSLTNKSIRNFLTGKRGNKSLGRNAKSMRYDGLISELMANENKGITDKKNEATIRRKYNLTEKDINKQRTKVRSMIPVDFRDDYDNESNQDLESESSINSESNSVHGLSLSASRTTLSTMLTEDEPSRKMYTFRPNSGGSVKYVPSPVSTRKTPASKRSMLNMAGGKSGSVISRRKKTSQEEMTKTPSTESNVIDNDNLQMFEPSIDYEHRDSNGKLVVGEDQASYSQVTGDFEMQV